MRIVQCHGCFDLLHLGHIRHLQAAKAAGDYLVVTVTPDCYVNKGPGRPVFTATQRAEALDALACVDAVEVTDSPTAAEAIRRIGPAVFAKGPDYSAASLDAGEAQALAEVGGMLLITPTEKWSSTALLHRDAHSPDVEAYLQAMRAKYSAADVLGWLEKARTLKTLVIGDAITDEYVYCQTLGKSGKEPILAAQYLRTESFVGGAHAVAMHARAVCDLVTLVAGEPTIKRRFIETYPFQKLFELYEPPDGVKIWAEEDVTWQLARAQQVIAADYGHGFITPAIRTALCQRASRLAVNTQANAGNHGFNTIRKYPIANFVSLSERELRLDAQDQETPIRDLMTRYVSSYDRLLVTRGAHGCVAVEEGQDAEAPGLISHTVDRMGAGDAVFAITACCAAVGMPLDLLTFVAAVVGTMAVGIVGNARYIERDALHAAITTWLR